MISPTEIGTRGNSHMIMQDKNHLQVADLILKWIDERVSKPTRREEVSVRLGGHRPLDDIGPQRQAPDRLAGRVEHG